MGLLNWLEDATTKAATGMETVRISYESLAKIIEKEFISGADEAFLKQVKKTAKGGFVFNKELITANERYKFHVGALQRGLWLLRSRSVWVLDKEENRFYQLDKDRMWSKFYKAVSIAIEMEMIDHRK